MTSGVGLERRSVPVAAGGPAPGPPLESGVSTARSQSEEAYLRIRDRIVSLEMAPGSVVHEARLREELEIGRTPIREALQRLALENLVTVVPHRGTFVTDINITDLARVAEVRVVLEGYAARLAAERAQAADLAIARDLLGDLGEGDLADQRALMRLDQRIHRQIYRWARNPYLEGTLEKYLGLSLRVWSLVVDHGIRLREAVAEHRELLQAVLDGDGVRAEASMRRHVIGFEREIRKVL